MGLVVAQAPVERRSGIRGQLNACRESSFIRLAHARQFEIFRCGNHLADTAEPGIPDGFQSPLDELTDVVTCRRLALRTVTEVDGATYERRLLPPLLRFVAPGLPEHEWGIVDSRDRDRSDPPIAATDLVNLETVEVLAGVPNEPRWLKLEGDRDQDSSRLRLRSSSLPPLLAFWHR